MALQSVLPALELAQLLVATAAAVRIPAHLSVDARNPSLQKHPGGTQNRESQSGDQGVHAVLAEPVRSEAGRPGGTETPSGQP
jgi:hypothetical protein